MANLPITDVDGLTAAAIMHPTKTSLESGATVADVRAYFAASSSRRLATLTDGERYVGAICVEGLAGAGDLAPDAPASELIAPHPTVTPDTPAAEARDHALAVPSRRVPVVDADGRLLGVVAIDKHRAAFCGTEHLAPRASV